MIVTAGLALFAFGHCLGYSAQGMAEVDIASTPKIVGLIRDVNHTWFDQ